MVSKVKSTAVIKPRVLIHFFASSDSDPQIIDEYHKRKHIERGYSFKIPRLARIDPE